MTNENTRWQAVANRVPAVGDPFVYGVVTTGVYCKPNCPSRRPLPQNVRFFDHVRDAQKNGFRPCKRCEPDEAEPNMAILKIAREILDKPENSWPLDELAATSHLSPAHFQKKFKMIIGLSPKKLHQAARRGKVRELLRNNAAVLDALFEAGYSSSSRMYDEVGAHLGMSPKKYQKGADQEIIHYCFQMTSWGGLMIAASAIGVCFVQFGLNEPMLIHALYLEFPQATLVAADDDQPQLKNWLEALNLYLNQQGQKPDLPLDLRGTAFQIMVWNFLTALKPGEQITYQELAKRLGRPKAIRAAASACASNRIGVLVPCHQVLRSDGGLGGYRWGLERKQQLLSLRL